MMDSSIDLDQRRTELERQLRDLTEQLRESQSIRDERDRFRQLYQCTNERFLTFEQKQLDQMRRLCTLLTSDQQNRFSEEFQRSNRASTSPLVPTPFKPTVKQHVESKSEDDWNLLLGQISAVMELTERFTSKCSEQIEENNKLRLMNSQKQEENVKLLIDLSMQKAEYETEHQVRVQLAKQLSDAQKVIEQDHSKRLQKLRNYASLADDEGDILLSSLMKKAEKNDVDFREMKLQYESVFHEQLTHVKKLVKERELLNLYIRRLEAENASLAATTNDDETIRLLTCAAQTPTSPEEAQVLIDKLREQIIDQIKIRDKLRHDLEQLQDTYKTDIREREQIEGLFHRDLTAAKDEILILQSVQSEYQHVFNLKNDLEKQFAECQNELNTSKAVTNSLTNQLKEQVEQLSREKEKLDEDNAGLRIQAMKLKMDFENSESVQHDFVKLSQALQMQLEEIRNSGTELRWRPEEDFSECQRCRMPFTVTWRKHHCRHCGKVLCKECTNKTVYTGPNHRASRVCEVCYTLLVKDSQPYFLSSVPKV